MAATVVAVNDILCLPTEVLTKICEKFCFHCEDSRPSSYSSVSNAPHAFFEGRSMLRALCLVSQRFCAVARPVLYHDLINNDWDWVRVFGQDFGAQAAGAGNSSVRASQFGQAVRRLDLRATNGRDLQDKSTVRGVLNLTKNIQDLGMNYDGTLVWDCVRPAEQQPGRETATAVQKVGCFRQLRTLRLQRHYSYASVAAIQPTDPRFAPPSTSELLQAAPFLTELVLDPCTEVRLSHDLPHLRVLRLNCSILSRRSLQNLLGHLPRLEIFQYISGLVRDFETLPDGTTVVVGGREATLAEICEVLSCAPAKDTLDAVAVDQALAHERFDWVQGDGLASANLTALTKLSALYLHWNDIGPAAVEDDEVDENAVSPAPDAMEVDASSTRLVESLPQGLVYLDVNGYLPVQECESLEAALRAGSFPLLREVVLFNTLVVGHRRSPGSDSWIWRANKEVNFGSLALLGRMFHGIPPEAI